MVKIPIKGEIIKNDDKWIYDWFEIEATCPEDVRKAIENAADDEITFVVNSPGGEISAGGELWYLISECKQKTTADVVGYACSAASYLIMAADVVRMAPSALMMIHRVSTSASGNCNVMDKEAAVLRVADKAISNAYRMKTGKSNEEILELMNEETWMDCEKAIELGLVDEIIGDDDAKPVDKKTTLYNSFSSALSDEVKEKIRNTVKNPARNEQDILLQQTKLNLLKLGGMRNV